MNAILNVLLGPVFQVLDKIIPDTNARAQAKEEMAQALQSMDLEVLKGQLGLNQAQAQSSSIFIAGARPFLLWGFGSALLYMVVIYPHLIYAAKLLGWPAPPGLDGDLLFSMVTAMLGLAGMRSFDKAKGVARHK